MSLFKSLKKSSGQKENPADSRLKQALDKWQNTTKKFNAETNETLERMIKEGAADPLELILAAYEIAKRGNVEFLSWHLEGPAARVTAAAEGLCYAGCNGNDFAIDALWNAVGHPDAAVRLRLIKSLEMVADGTPGDVGFSTTLGRERARAIIKSAADDKDSEVRRWVEHALGATEAVREVRRGEGVLTYLGRRLSETVLQAVDS